MSARSCHNCKYNGKGDAICIRCARRRDSPMHGKVKPVPTPLLEKLATQDEVLDNPSRYAEGDARILEFFNTWLALPPRDQQMCVALIVESGNCRAAARRCGITAWAAMRSRARLRLVPCLNALLAATEAGGGRGYARFLKSENGGQGAQGTV